MEFVICRNCECIKEYSDDDSRVGLVYVTCANCLNILKERSNTMQIKRLENLLVKLEKITVEEKSSFFRSVLTNMEKDVKKIIEFKKEQKS